MATPTWGAFLRSAIGVVTEQEASAESASIAYAIASAQSHGISRAEFAAWVLGCWDAAERDPAGAILNSMPRGE